MPVYNLDMPRLHGADMHSMLASHNAKASLLDERRRVKPSCIWTTSSVKISVLAAAGEMRLEAPLPVIRHVLSRQASSRGPSHVSAYAEAPQLLHTAYRLSCSAGGGV